MSTTKEFADRIVNEIQELEEMYGPRTLEQYIAVLTMVKTEIEKRISVAGQRIADETCEFDSD